MIDNFLYLFPSSTIQVVHQQIIRTMIVEYEAKQRHVQKINTERTPFHFVEFQQPLCIKSKPNQSIKQPDNCY